MAMHLPTDLKYAASHEWARLEADGSVSVGITDHAQAALGDVVFLQLPEPGRRVAAGEEVALIESVKAASGIHAPLAGVVSAVNAEVSDAPESVNDKPYTTWLFRLTPDNAADIQELLDAAAYSASLD